MKSTAEVQERLFELHQKGSLTTKEAAEHDRLSKRLREISSQIMLGEEVPDAIHSSRRFMNDAEAQHVYEQASDPDVMMQAFKKHYADEKRRKSLRAFNLPTYILRRDEPGSSEFTREIIPHRSEPRACLAGFLTLVSEEHRHALEGTQRLSLCMPRDVIDRETSEEWGIDVPTLEDWNEAKKQHRLTSSDDLQLYEYQRDLQLRKLKEYCQKMGLVPAVWSVFGKPKKAPPAIQEVTVTLIPRRFTSRVFPDISELHYSSLLFSTAAVDHGSGKAHYQPTMSFPASKEELDSISYLLGRGPWLSDGEVILFNTQTDEKGRPTKTSQTDVQVRTYQRKTESISKGYGVQHDVEHAKERMIQFIQDLREGYAQARELDRQADARHDEDMAQSLRDNAARVYAETAKFERIMRPGYRILRAAVRAAEGGGNSCILDTEDVIKVNSHQAVPGPALMICTYLTGRDYEMSCSSQFTQLMDLAAKPGLAAFLERALDERVTWKLHTPEAAAGLVSNTIGNVVSLDGENLSIEEEAMLDELEQSGVFGELDGLRHAMLSDLVQHTNEGITARREGTKLPMGAVRMPDSIRRRFDPIVGSQVARILKSFGIDKMQAGILLTCEDSQARLRQLWGLERHETLEYVEENGAEYQVVKETHDVPFSRETGMKLLRFENKYTGETLSLPEFKERRTLLEDLTVDEERFKGDGWKNGRHYLADAWAPVYGPAEEEPQQRFFVPHVITKMANGDNDGDYIAGMAADVWITLKDGQQMLVKMVKNGRYPLVDGPPCYILPPGTPTPFDADEEDITCERTVEAGGQTHTLTVPLGEMTDEELLETARDYAGQHPQLTETVRRMTPDVDKETGEVTDPVYDRKAVIREIDEAVNWQRSHYRQFLEALEPRLDMTPDEASDHVFSDAITIPETCIRRLAEDGVKGNKSTKKRRGDITIDKTVKMGLEKAEANGTGFRTRNHERMAVLRSYALAMLERAEEADRKAKADAKAAILADDQRVKGLTARQWYIYATTLDIRLKENADDIEDEISSWKKEKDGELNDPRVWMDSDPDFGTFDSIDDVMNAMPFAYHDVLRRKLKYVTRRAHASSRDEREGKKPTRDGLLDLETMPEFGSWGKETDILNHGINRAGARIVAAMKGIQTNLQPFCQQLRRKLQGTVTDEIRQEASRAIEELKTWSPAVRAIMDDEQERVDRARERGRTDLDLVREDAAEMRKKCIGALMQSLSSFGRTLSKEALMLAVLTRWENAEELRAANRRSDDRDLRRRAKGPVNTTAEIALMGNRITEVFPRPDLSQYIPSPSEKRRSLRTYCRTAELKEAGLQTLPGDEPSQLFSRRSSKEATAADLVWSESHDCFLLKTKTGQVVPLYPGDGELDGIERPKAGVRPASAYRTRGNTVQVYL